MFENKWSSTTFWRHYIIPRKIFLVKAIKKQELTLTSSYNHCLKHPNKKKIDIFRNGLSRQRSSSFFGKIDQCPHYFLATSKSLLLANQYQCHGIFWPISSNNGSILMNLNDLSPFLFFFSPSSYNFFKVEI